MKKLFKKITIVVFILVSQHTFAYNEKSKDNKGQDPVYNKAGCSPARATLIFNIMMLKQE